MSDTPRTPFGVGLPEGLGPDCPGHSAVTVLVTPVSVYCPLLPWLGSHDTEVSEGGPCPRRTPLCDPGHGAGLFWSRAQGWEIGLSSCVGSDETTAPHACPRASCRPASGGHLGLSSWAFSCSPAPAGRGLDHTAFCSLGQAAPSTSQGGPAGDTPICRGWHMGWGGGREVVLLCFTDGETEAQRGRSMWSSATAGGECRQTWGRTPAQ